jgi:ribose 5-phosphate isomerase A
VLRKNGEAPVVTDNANMILDCAVGPIADAVRLEGTLRSIPGVVGTGLFVGMADIVLVAHGGRVTEMSKPGTSPSLGL